MSELARAALSAEAAGYQACADEDFAAACGHFERALGALAASTVPPAHATRRLGLHAALIEVLVECDRLDDAERELELAVAAQALSRASGEPVPDFVAAKLLLMHGAIHIWRRRPEAAIAPLQDAVRLASAAAGCDPALRAACHARLAVAFSLSDRLEEASDQNQAAWALLEQPAAHPLGKERSRVLANQGNIEWTRGRVQEARRHYADALAILDGLLAAGCLRRKVDIARACRNLGGALTSCDEFDAAIESYRRALDIYAGEIRRASRSQANIARLLASQASTRMNLGYTLFRAQQFDRAGATFRVAMRDYKALAEQAPHLQDDEARTWVNQAHLLHRQGRSEAARRGYARAARTFAQLVAKGKEHLRADAANAQLGLARVLAAQGRSSASGRWCEAALGTLCDLSRQGQLHRATAWLQGVLGVCDALLVRSVQVETGSTSGPREAAAALRAVGRALRAPPQRGHPIAAEQLDELDQCIERAAAWRRQLQPNTFDAWTLFIGDFIRFLLDWMAVLLGNSDPHWLHQHAGPVAATVERLRGAAAAQADGGALLVDWFLSTRGLRAQRDALVHSSDERVRELASMQQQLRRLEEELLGQQPDPAHGTARSLRAQGADNAKAAAAAPQPDTGEQWQHLQRRYEALRQRLADDAVLPRQLRLRSDALAQHTAPQHALIMIARPAADRIVVFATARDARDRAWIDSADVPLAAELARFGCRQLIDMARLSVVDAARGRGLRHAAVRPPSPAAVRPPSPTPGTPGTPSHADMAEFAAAALQALAAAVAAPIKSWWTKHQWQAVALTPSDDLHLVPWAHELSRHLVCALHVYPSVGAWLRHHDPMPPLEATPKRWAMAACSAGGVAGSELPWVQIEQALCRRLWAEAGATPVVIDAANKCADGVGAFVGMGHGSALPHDLGRAGLALAADAVLTAHDLPAMRVCRRVVLSCCVLGQTQDVFGEPLGFLSTAFGYDAGFGSGWLIEVPDAHACLFSVAFQFALQQAPQLPDAMRSGWHGVFEATRRGIARGQWPVAFGPWLERNMGAAAEGLPGIGSAWQATLQEWSVGGALYRSPPESLGRLMPWAVCLGRG